VIMRWVKAALAVAAAAVLGWSAIADALVNITHTRNPKFALRLDAHDPVALVRHAEVLLAAGDADASAKVTAALRESVRAQALNPRAFQLLGFASEGSEASAKIGELMAFSNRLSRRNLPTQLWLIEEAVGRNDVARVLELYDIALRSRPSSEAWLFPVLSGAMDEPVIRRHFLPYMHSRPPWLQAFLRTAITTTSNPQAIADLVVEAGGMPQLREYRDFNGQLIGSLASHGDYTGALEFYRRLPRTDPGVTRTAAMTRSTTDPRYAPVTWQIYQLDGIDATFVATSKEGVQIAAQLDTTYVGPIAQKLLQLAPGTYDLVADHDAPDATALSLLTWRVKCAGENGAVLVVRENGLLGTSRTNASTKCRSRAEPAPTGAPCSLPPSC